MRKSLEQQCRERRLERELERMRDWREFHAERLHTIGIIRAVLCEMGMSRREFHYRHFLKLIRA